MQDLINKVEDTYRKKQVVDVRSGDTVRVHQKIKEGNKERVQVFEGFVIRTDRKKSVTSRITVRRISGGVGVEKSFLLHSPLVVKVEVVKRAKVRRKNLTFMRERSGKGARLAGVDFDKESVNTLDQMIDAEVGKTVESKHTDVTKKDKEVESLDSPEEKKKDEKSAASDKPDEKTAKKTDDTNIEENVKEPETEKPSSDNEEKKELSKKEKAEAFRKAQEEKKK